MVEKRKRMLQTFLNRVAKHPILGHDHVFHRFLEAGTAWVGCAVLKGNGCLNLISLNSTILVRRPPFTTAIYFTQEPITNSVQHSNRIGAGPNEQHHPYKSLDS